MKRKQWEEKDLCFKGRHNGCSRCLPFTSYYSVNRPLLFQLAVAGSYTVRNNNQEANPFWKNTQPWRYSWWQMQDDLKERVPDFLFCFISSVCFCISSLSISCLDDSFIYQSITCKMEAKPLIAFWQDLLITWLRLSLKLMIKISLSCVKKWQRSRWNIIKNKVKYLLLPACYYLLKSLQKRPFTSKFTYRMYLCRLSMCFPLGRSLGEQLWVIHLCAGELAEVKTK